MIDKVYEELTRDREKILNKLQFFRDNLKDTIKKEKIDEVWVEYEPNPIKKSFIAIDGGEFIKETRFSTVYVSNAEAILAKGLQEYIPIDNEAKIGVLSPGNLSRERVSELMSILELSLALRNGDKADIILMDGSIIKKLGKGKGISGKENPNIDEILNISNEEESYNNLILNKQIILSKLIQKYGDKILWISKNSKGKDIFAQQVSDIAVLESLTENPGYTKPRIHQIKSEYLVENDEVSILKGIEISSFLMRLEKGQKVLKVDITGRIDESNIKYFMDCLSLVSVNGYPYPLLKVHFDVKANKEDRLRILTLFNLLRKQGNSWIPNQFF
ncbi:hypothetical protein DFR86_02475 [Acidianus sulfidivorans JP7]|uniref:NurA domain-containing protein n=1 Tax=Acidianus sulfidivorans JP7 TaxID=619593 RepID=A0A2U9IKI4_9CREN|nr:DNA double-strand break repair nuclease NurA [Acidianus sulfidivorans]AWR96523.1 hypothetical protein DFR86_02475 [Acidianus sulfidivorans JP7]